MNRIQQDILLLVIGFTIGVVLCILVEFKKPFVASKRINIENGGAKIKSKQL